MDAGFKRALQLSAGAHLFLAAALMINFHWFDKNEVIIVPLYSSSDAPLQATMIENPKIKQADKAQRRKEEPKKDEPKEPPKEEPKEEPKKEEPKEDPLKQQEQMRLAQKKKEEDVKKKLEAEKKKRDEDALALKKKKQQEQKKKEDELKKKQLEEEKKKKEAEAKKKKAEAEKKRKADQKKIQQELARELEQLNIQDELADEAEEATRAARQGKQLTEKERYVAMIVERITQNWFTDDTMNGKQCVIRLRLASNGFVTSSSVEGGDPSVCQAAMAALNRVGNLPMPEDPELNAQFRDLTLPFVKRPGN